MIARSDQGRLPVRSVPVQTGELLERVAERFEQRARARSRDIRVELEGDLEARADPLRLEQALRNLVENALRHGAGTVTLSARARDGHIELHVTDEGPGFPPGFEAHAFERFTRADAARSRGGSGLGLAIVAAIADAHGGRARAANRPQGGADVSLELPSSPPHRPSLEPLPESDKGADS